MQLVLVRLLEADRQMQVVGQASDGEEALELAEQLQPDVITLDVEMPKMDGLQVLKKLLPRHPIPVVMLSSLTQLGAETTVKALQLGAVDFVGKPGSAGVPDLETVQKQLLHKIRVAARAQVRIGTAPRRAQISRVKAIRAGKTPTVLIAASTGGPSTLDFLLSALPENLPAAIAITQHMPPQFTRVLAERLNQKSALEIKEAQEGDSLQPATALIAPGDYHMLLESNGVVHLSRDQSVWGVRPAADPMMQSAATNLNTPLIGAVLTVMGQDGAQGAVAIKDRGGTIITEAEESCVIYGMPKAAVETGCCDFVVPLPEIPQKLVDIISTIAGADGPRRKYRAA